MPMMNGQFWKFKWENQTNRIGIFKETQLTIVKITGNPATNEIESVQDQGVDFAANLRTIGREFTE